MGYRSEKRNIRLALAGDAMPARRLDPFDEPDYLALVELVRGADAAIANLETTVRTEREGTPNLTQGTPMSTPPALIADLRWMGIGMVSTANNHATDYGPDGLMAMRAHLARAGMPAAGAGANLAEARRPAYLDTAAGRVALVATTSFFPPWTRAADQRPDARGRPGVNPIGFSATYTVDGASFAALRAMSDRLGFAAERERHRAMFFSASEAPADSEAELVFLGSRFRRGDGFSVSTRANRSDADAILRAIGEARRQADWVVFSFHNHEFGAAGRLTAQTSVGMEGPAEFAAAFAREAIEAGADVVAMHGPHLTLGVEIHRGRPILYSLGNFIFQNDNVPVFPAESYQRFGLDHLATPTDFLDARTGNETRGFPAAPEYWHGVLAEVAFEAGKLAAVLLHPLDLGHGRPRASRGRPLIARGPVAAAVLDRVQRLSARHGTDIAIEGETGVVRVV